MSEADPRFGSATKDDWTWGPIFDADVHIDPPHDMWKHYLPESQKAKAPVIEHGALTFDTVARRVFRI